MNWQVLAVGTFTLWLSLGAAIGAWLGPVHHWPGFHVQSLYQTEAGRLTVAAATPARLVVDQP